MQTKDDAEKQSAPDKHLSELALAEIRDLREKGIEPTLDEVIWLNDLARKVEKPSEGAGSSPYGEPVYVSGGVWLWPWTVQAIQWYRKALKWFDGQEELELYALGYALARGRYEGAFDDIHTYHTAKDKLVAWSETLPCTPEELTTAISDLLARDNEEMPAAPDTVDDGGDSDWQGVIAQLTAETGTDPDVWNRKVCITYLLRQIQSINRTKRAEGQAPDPFDPYVLACKALGLAVLAIKRRRSGGES
jgi:hypothetical protein